MTTTSSDELVRDYLDRLGRAAAGLPPAAREELLEEILIHIEAALADSLAAGRGDGPLVARRVLDRLGTPEEVAAAAAAEHPTEGPPAGPSDGGSGGEIAAVLLCGIGWIFALGWVIGLVLTIRSRRWTGWQKLAVALLPVPAWLLLTVAHEISAGGGSSALVGACAVLAFAAPLALGALLVRRAR